MEYSPVPNQRRVTIHKVDQAPFYTKIDPASCKQAMGALHYSAFKLYMYFCLNATNFVLFPTPSVFCDEINLPRNTYYTAYSFDKPTCIIYTVCNTMYIPKNDGDSI